MRGTIADEVAALWLQKRDGREATTCPASAPRSCNTPDISSAAQSVLCLSPDGLTASTKRHGQISHPRQHDTACGDIGRAGLPAEWLPAAGNKRGHVR